MLDIRIQLVADYWLWLPARRQDQLVGGPSAIVGVWDDDGDFGDQC